MSNPFAPASVAQGGGDGCHEGGDRRQPNLVEALLLLVRSNHPTCAIYDRQSVGNLEAYATQSYAQNIQLRGLVARQQGQIVQLQEEIARLRAALQEKEEAEAAARILATMLVADKQGSTKRSRPS
jgi:uncharacterized small protein (DUF1192 family)